MVVCNGNHSQVSHTQYLMKSSQGLQPFGQACPALPLLLRLSHQISAWEQDHCSMKDFMANISQDLRPMPLCYGHAIFPGFAVKKNSTLSNHEERLECGSHHMRSFESSGENTRTVKQAPGMPVLSRSWLRYPACYRQQSSLTW